MSLGRSINVGSKTTGGFFKFLWKRKLYWLIPLMIIIFMFTIVIIFAGSTGLGPLIYPFI